MKKFFIANFTLFIVTSIFFMPQSSLAQNKGAHSLAIPQPHFFIHGWGLPWGAGTSEVSNMASDMKTRFGWGVDPVLPGYDGLTAACGSCGVSWADAVTFPVTGVHKQLTNAFSGDYVGLGYSEGGLFARYEAQQYGSGFVTGLVTDHTPNTGTWMGDFGHRADWVARWIDATLRMHRGDMGFLYWAWEVGGGVLLEAAIEIAAQAVNLLATAVLGGLPQDAAPGSGLLNSINGTQPAGVLRVAVWGQTQYPYSAYYTSDDEGAAWKGAESAARQNSHDNDNLANGVHPHWWCPWRYVQQAWYRSRAGDWSATANAMDDVENDWEDNTAGRGDVSDGFVGIESQKAIPSADAVVEDGYTGLNVNHGNAVYNGDITLRDHVETALKDAGAQ